MKEGRLAPTVLTTAVSSKVSLVPSHSNSSYQRMRVAERDSHKPQSCASDRPYDCSERRHSSIAPSMGCPVLVSS